MNILHVNGYQSPGRRFHGLALAPLLATHGIHSHHLVWEQDKQEQRVFTINRGLLARVTRSITKLEKALSLQSLLYPAGHVISRLQEFRQADLLHLHIIHSGFLSVHSLPTLAQLKPTIWTLHDPWALTGHCVYPGDCRRWLTGCGQCPSLDSPFPLRTDRTAFLFRQKQRAYSRLTVDLVVASEWMRRLVASTPLFHAPTIRLHHIPFGINLERFSPQGISEARQRFDIPRHHVVLMFRAEGAFKGVPYILDALDQLSTHHPVTLLTVGSKGILDKYRSRFGIVELGWTNDDDLLLDAFKTCDVFLMPSTAEAFGVMAIEAMACGKPVICFEGTALPDVIEAPQVGIAVPMRDSVALSKAISDLIESPSERSRRGAAARRRAEMHFSVEAHVTRIVNLYHEVASRCA